ncbi:hypothetical protein BV98_001894 [Sphingobium herbicidovorans NBRC 16415]|uniref:Uncharacterized protein n=1 Tax=Sphingobium herbicidovorans (strain ATCC 700291 / DSM 11019 / CCUG 56400 / KCTC 2939 / LMG 18315 / NBRC 16415 / MH) TaxID=1219045 RepID=A0A086PBC1_SPHHM|nr:hypothetical protein [Sphingobium herbicidovorans]KFG90689.1 hypothetical protein BV98_001894 [Sphingobium herbicidovorans NBRC 16415]
MTDLSFAIASETHDLIDVADMGDGALILTESNEDGTVARIALSFDQLEAAYLALAPRYSDAPAMALAA